MRRSIALIVATGSAWRASLVSAPPTGWIVEPLANNVVLVSVGQHDRTARIGEWVVVDARDGSLHQVTNEEYGQLITEGNERTKFLWWLREVAASDHSPINWDESPEKIAAAIANIFECADYTKVAP